MVQIRRAKRAKRHSHRGKVETTGAGFLARQKAGPGSILGKPFPLVVSEAHRAHRVRDAGYLERPERAEALRKVLRDSGLFQEIKARRFSERAIRAAAEYFGASCGCEAAEPFVLVRSLES